MRVDAIKKRFLQSDRDTGSQSTEDARTGKPRGRRLSTCEQQRALHGEIRGGARPSCFRGPQGSAPGGPLQGSTERLLSEQEEQLLPTRPSLFAVIIIITCAVAFWSAACDDKKLSG